MVSYVCYSFLTFLYFFVIGFFSLKFDVYLSNICFSFIVILFFLILKYLFRKNYSRRLKIFVGKMN